MGHLKCVLLLLLTGAVFHLSGSSFVTDVFNNGSYTVSVNGETWLQSAATFFRADGKVYSLVDGTLKLLKTRTANSSDRIGSFTAICYDLAAGVSDITACIRQYDNNPFAIFQQTYTNGANATSAGDTDSIIAGFPYFQLFHTKPSIGFMSYGGSMFGADIRYGNFAPGKGKTHSGIDSGPVVLFDTSDNVLILSPFNQFMAASVYYSTRHDVMGWGVMGGVDTVPEGYTYETILYYGDQGINKAMAGWGDTLRRFYNKDDSYRRTDLTLTHIGYWTDGGAYYFYNTEPAKNYEQTILDVWDYSKRANLPYRFVQYDSYFYSKGPKGGVKTWTPMPDLFPDGFYNIYKKTGWPAGAHNRWWSDETTYAKQNGGQFEFLIDVKKGMALPTHEKFWDYLFDTAREWGLTLYEQDHLNQQFNGLNATLTDIDLGRTWLIQMGKAALKNGLTIQYCMSYPRHAMQSLEIPVVTQARVSGDYRAGKDNWKIGANSLFADAMGIAPFKDNFWTTKNQPGNPKYPDLQETHAELHAMAATLSTGPVAPGDMISATNVTMLMQCCNADGLLLKPSKPAMAINAQLLQSAFNTGGPDGEVYTTYTQIGQFFFGIILAADLQSKYVLTPYEAGFLYAYVGRSAEIDRMRLQCDPCATTVVNQFSPKVVFSRMMHNATKVFPFASEGLALGLECSKTFPCLYYTSPVFNISGSEVLLYGETNKFVPVSPQRVTNINVLGQTDLQVTIEGAQDESLTFLFLQDQKYVTVFCTVGSSGSAVISFKSRSCRAF